MRDSKLWFVAAAIALAGALIAIAPAGNAVPAGALALFATVFFVLGLDARTKSGRA